jgi:Protein of unknown function (DUF1353)
MKLGNFSHQRSILIMRWVVLMTIFSGTLLATDRPSAQELCNEAEVAANTCLLKAGTGKDDWLEANLGTKQFGAPPKFSKFFDRVYYLNTNIEWTPDKPIPGITKVVVPKGFVTDFASVPRIFWPILPPDDEYLVPAIVHDWLYWQQTVSKERADSVLRNAMEELKVAGWKVAAVYQGVANFGTSAWDKNGQLKLTGEKRILIKEPPNISIKWADWRLQNPPVVK